MTIKRGQPWLTAVALLVMFTIVCTPFAAIGPFVLPWTKQFGLTRAQAGSFATAASIAVAVFSWLVGSLVERIEIRKVMATGIILTGIAPLLATKATGYVSLLACCVLLGVGMGLGGIVVCSTLVTDWFDHNRGVAMGVVIAGGSAFGIFGYPLVTYLIRARGTERALLFLGLPAFLVALPLLVFAVLGRRKSITSVGGPEAQMAELEGFDLRTAFHSRSFWLVALGQLCTGYVIEGVGVHLIPYLVETGYTAIRAAFFLSFIAILSFVTKMLVSAWSDRVGPRNALITTFLVGGIGQLMLLKVAEPVFLAIAVLSVGLSFSTQTPVMPLLLAECVGRKRFATLQGICVFTFYAGLGAGPFIMGLLYDLTRSYRTSFEIGAAFCFATAVMILGCKPYQAAEPSILSSAQPAISSARD